MLALKTILHPTDFSPRAEHAFHLACALARDHGSRLIVLHVQAPAETIAGEFGTLPPVPGPTLAELQARLNQIRPPDAKIPIERQLVTGDPAEQIMAVARASGCDLIAMGTHGHRGLMRLLMGSVAEKVVRNAPCPVLTVKTPKASG